MNKYLYFTYVYFSIIVGFSQSRISIDSLNNLPFQIKQEKASLLCEKYLINAKNAQKINYKYGEAESFSNASLTYYYLGNYQNDIKYSLKAIAIYEELKIDEKISLEYGELGFRMKKTNLAKAILYMQKAKKIAEQGNLKKPLLSIYNNYGYLKELKNENDSALYFFKKGLLLKEKIKDSVGLPYSLNNIALIYIKQKKFQIAEKLLDRAFNIRCKLNDQVGIAENYFYFGDLNYKQNKIQDALVFYKKSLKIALKNNYLDLAQNCYLIISQCYEKTRYTKLSLYNFKKYKKYNDSLLNIETSSKIVELEIQFDTSKKEKQIIKQAAEAKQKNFLLFGLSIFAILIGLVGFLIYHQQRLKNKQQEQEFQLKSAISQIETQNKLQDQRLSISRDLHDNIGAQLTFIISSVDNIKYVFEIENPKLDNKLTNISCFAKDTIVELRDTIWAMNSNEITYEDLQSRINNFMEKAKETMDQISFSFAVDEELKLKKLSSVQGMNIYRTIQEAINNAIKYADANIISVNIKKQDNQTKIKIQDNGKGFDQETIEKGNGLKNMQKRIEEIGGKFSLFSDNEGTKIEILI